MDVPYRHYDYIVSDTPPIGSMVKMRLLFVFVMQAMLVVASNVVKRKVSKSLRPS